MSLGGPPREEPLHVFLMVIALIAAAFAGAFLGKLWYSTVGEDEGQPAEENAQVPSEISD